MIISLTAICFTIYDWLIWTCVIVHKEMTGRNNHATPDALKEMTNVMAQAKKLYRQIKIKMVVLMNFVG